MKRVYVSFAMALVFLVCGGRDACAQGTPAKNSAQPRGPLGTRTNPIRCDGPTGEHHYLSRLRDFSDQPIVFQRSATVQDGPYGSTLSGYSVAYRDGYTRELFFDMHHPGVVEKEAPPGYRLAPPPSPAKLLPIAVPPRVAPKASNST